jgi:pimeloyl-ACP methyl ester carboxylesterase
MAYVPAVGVLTLSVRDLPVAFPMPDDVAGRRGGECLVVGVLAVDGEVGPAGFAVAAVRSAECWTDSVITFDNRGVGASTGTTPRTIQAMAKDAVTFIRALGLEYVDLHGFSMCGMVAQVIAQTEPQLVRKLILTGTGPAGGEGIKNVSRLSHFDTVRGLPTLQDPKQFLFFTRTAGGRRAGKEFLARLKERTHDRGKAISLTLYGAQLKAIHRWGLEQPHDLSVIHQPVLVANGESDRMVPSQNSADLARRVPNGELVIYPDAGHGGIFQFHRQFVQTALEFLER